VRISLRRYERNRSGPYGIPINLSCRRIKHRPWVRDCEDLGSEHIDLNNIIRTLRGGGIAKGGVEIPVSLTASENKVLTNQILPPPWEEFGRLKRGVIKEKGDPKRQ